MKKNKRSKTLLTLCIGLLLIGINVYLSTKGLNLESLREYLIRLGPIAPIIYIVLFTLVPLTFFPDAILVIASGMVFGFGLGTIYTIIGAFFGSTLSFFIARKLGQRFFDRFEGSVKELSISFDNKGFIIVLMLRLIPLFPFDLISYSAGLSRVRYKNFMGATLLGALPGIMVYVNLGASSLNLSSSKFYISLTLLLSLFLGAYYLKNTRFFKELISTNN